MVYFSLIDPFGPLQYIQSTLVLGFLDRNEITFILQKPRSSRFDNQKKKIKNTKKREIHNIKWKPSKIQERERKKREEREREENEVQPNLHFICSDCAQVSKSFATNS